MQTLARGGNGGAALGRRAVTPFLCVTLRSPRLRVERPSFAPIEIKLRHYCAADSLDARGAIGP